jgi:hypothetical protein
MTWEDIVALGSELPEVGESTCFGTPALRVGKRLLARFRPEDDSLVLLDVPVEERAMLIEADPLTFHMTPHYQDYPTVLARLSALAPETARAFLKRRWRNVAPKRALKLLEAGEQA